MLGQRQGATIGASVDVVSINPTGSNMNLGVTLNYDNQEGLSTDLELGFTNNPMLQSLGLNVNIGSAGASGSMTQNGGTMGTVDQDGNYEANENFLGEISGYDIAENNGTLNAQNDSDAENDSDNPRESEPQVDGLIPFLIGTGVSLVTAAATAVAGSSTSSGSGRPTSGSSGQGGSVVNPVGLSRKREGEGSDGDSIASGEGSGGDGSDGQNPVDNFYNPEVADSYSAFDENGKPFTLNVNPEAVAKQDENNPNKPFQINRDGVASVNANFAGMYISKIWFAGKFEYPFRGKFYPDLKLFLLWFLFGI